MQLRDPSDVCYSWASAARGELSMDCLSNDQMLWEGAISLMHGLRSPAEVGDVCVNFVCCVGSHCIFFNDDLYYIVCRLGVRCILHLLIATIG